MCRLRFGHSPRTDMTFRPRPQTVPLFPEIDNQEFTSQLELQNVLSTYGVDSAEAPVVCGPWKGFFSSITMPSEAVSSRDIHVRRDCRCSIDPATPSPVALERPAPAYSPYAPSRLLATPVF